MVNLALRDISHAVHLTPYESNWPLLSYSVGYAAVLFVAGALIDKTGLRFTFLLGIAILVGANALCAWAPNKDALIVGRAIAGLGGGINTVCLIPLITSSLPDAKDRNRGLTLLFVSGPLGMVCGIIIGALVTESSVGWRGIFWITMILCAVLFVLAVLLVPSRAQEPVKECRESVEEAGEARSQCQQSQNPPFDYIGVILACVGIPCLIYGLNDGPNRGWTDPAVLSTLVIGGVCILALPVYDGWFCLTADPFIPREMLHSVNMILMTFNFLFNGGGITAWWYLVTQTLLNGLQYSPIRSALYLLPAAFACLASAPVAGFLASKLSERTQITGAWVWMAAFLIPWALIPEHVSPAWPIVFAMCYIVANVPGIVRAQAAVLSTIPQSQHARIGSLLAIVFQVGGSTLIALMNVLVAATSSNDSPASVLHGYHNAAWLLCGVMAASAVLFVLLYRKPRDTDVLAGSEAERNEGEKVEELGEVEE
ncbi:hypothetical protein ASPZODRAFT_167652 [Penicilliopsis zonata CBS 506.65]|uniref:Major facilitator superfamily (MFS) profile domain-containing protein n=1 Tax=Penicilliopsis zonata CBS 506.65 TaxID=1073090 RepID=A0A1L9SFH7_9EURO|nr:hypothetical protein ASPZODRAFT_167652 [Penicilliopsis zonata CBS 506.65]OJJ45956.1 hypothetical protein ASPZODRAFT_167652 [Penicilliopsis zonata CBS 506.65]